MTICMGALCQQEARGDTVVLASDRMVTCMGLTEFEHQVPRSSHSVASGKCDAAGRLAAPLAAVMLPSPP